MVKVLTNLKKYRLDFVFILFLVLATFYTWRGILGQTIEGEGFYYFSPTQSLIHPNGRVANLLQGYDNFPKILTYFLESAVDSNMYYYMLTQFIIIFLVNISVYFFVRISTGNSWVAILSSIYSGVNYTGNFQFYARGHYQWFTQRVPEVIVVMVSLIFLVNFLKTKSTKNYVLSILFLIIAIFMTHYTAMFVPLYPAIFLTTFMFLNKPTNEKVSLLYLSLPFILISYLIINNSSLDSAVIRGNEPLSIFLTNSKDVLSKISFQLVVVTIPFNFLQYLNEQIYENYLLLIPKLEIPIYSVYAATIFYLYKKRSPYLQLVTSLFLALLGTLFLTVYTGRVDVFNQIEQGRYYYIPAIYVGIIFACLFYSVIVGRFTQKLKFKTLRAIILLLIVFYWIFTNSKAIFKKNGDFQYFFDASKKMFEYLASVKSTLPEDAVVFIPHPPGSNSVDFLQKYYSSKNTQFLYFDKNWKLKLPQDSNPEKIFVFNFSAEYKKGGGSNIQNIVVLDESSIYRKELK